MTDAEVPGGWRWRKASREPGPAVVVDIDGVLSDATSRLHLIENRPRDWPGFFAAAAEDPLIDEIALLLDLLDPALGVVLLTGRPVSILELTLLWLDRHQVRWDLLIMRTEGDYTAAPDFKRGAVERLRLSGWDLRLALDDDPRNVAAFAAVGLPTLLLDPRGASPA